MEERLKKVMAQVFEIPVEKIGDDAEPGRIESWDSMRHLMMALAVEEEFGVSFTDEEIVGLVSFKLIISALEARGVS